VRDVLDRALAGQLRKAWSRAGKFTLREETLRYTQHDPLVAWAMMFGLSDRVDHPLREWDEAFLSDELERLHDTTSYVDSHGLRVPLVARQRLLYDAKRAPAPAEPTRRWPALLLLGALIGLAALTLATRVRPGAPSIYRLAYAALTAAIGVSAGLFGTLLLNLWAFSDHLVAHRNENLLLAHPVSLLAGLTSLALLSRTLRAADVSRWLWGALGVSTTLLLAAHVALPCFAQDIHWSAALLAPINLACALASRRVFHNAQRPAAAGALGGGADGRELAAR
jgi:hypothetical protein